MQLRGNTFRELTFRRIPSDYCNFAFAESACRFPSARAPLRFIFPSGSVHAIFKKVYVPRIILLNVGVAV